MSHKQPKVYLTGSTTIKRDKLEEYLIDTGNEEFIAELTGVDTMDIVSFFAKLCYKSLTVGHNDNISRTRDIANNFIGCIKSGHHSVLEHATLNFVVENASRIATTEQLRHRVGAAYSGESGRYCSVSNLNMWLPSVIADNQEATAIFKEMITYAESSMAKLQTLLIKEGDSFDVKKEATSAIRRLKPMGAGETLGFSYNLRTLRHVIELRTNAQAEEEIRVIFNQVADLVAAEIPLLFTDATYQTVKGHRQITFKH